MRNLQLFLGIHEGLVPGFPVDTKILHAQVPYVKWHSIYRNLDMSARILEIISRLLRIPNTM